MATEQCPWRGEVIRGKVHDDNCYAMGGVAGHAGLFGTARAVYSATATLWPIGLQESLPKTPHPKSGEGHSEWVTPLGWDTPSAGHSSSGRFFSKERFGHLGFTGTSIWVDPVHLLVVILLTNRVHPSRKNERIKQFRPEIHDIIFQQVIGV